MLFYNLLIQPLILLIDILFVFFLNYFGVVGVAVIFLSIAVNLMALPLYRQADKIQKEEQRKQKKMKPGIDHIKKSFSGDEQYMMLSAYYKIEHYSPMSVLKESFPLLLQIPIFIAAYRYLSSAPRLTGVSFGPIIDLGAQDMLLSIGGVSLNLLPILMTVLNLFSGLIYTRGHGLRLKLQVFSLAAVFLVLLYKSSSGLVLYWTMSQLFSLGKNLIMETDIFRKRKVLLPLSIATIFISLICTVTRIIQTNIGLVISEFCLILSFLYLVHVILDLKGVKLPKLSRFGKYIPECKYSAFIAVCACLFFLFGLCIPSSVLSASASEFVESTTGKFQWFLLTYPITVYAGLLLIWASVYYYFSGNKGRKILFGVFLALLGAAAINYFAFDMKPEFYYTDLSFDGELIAPRRIVILNVLIGMIGIAALFTLWIKKQRILKNLAVIVAVALVFLGGYHVIQIPKGLETEVKSSENSVETNQENLTGVLSLSKTEKNVVILMLDRAVGTLVPYIFHEFPKYKDAFDGFTYYPNTISYATHTTVGAPPLYGGYEYTPKAIAESQGETEDQQKAEAFKMLPVLFSQSGFDTTVCDPALYSTALYDEYPDIEAYKLEGKFNQKYQHFFHTSVVPVQMRNFLVFSIYKTAPIMWRDYIYDNGGYMRTKDIALGYTQAFIDNYSTLVEYPNLTAAVDSDKGSFLFLQNATTHEPSALDAPDYEVKAARDKYNIVYGDRTVDGMTMKMDDFWSWRHYCVNVVAHRELTHWFEKLKELGVYDNTRIIIVADHGAGLGQFDSLIRPDGFDCEAVNPLLMVKDYNEHGSLKTSDEFMTNADVATLATQDVIENPVNPFTGKEISNDAKYSDRQYIERTVKRQRTSAEDKLSLDDIYWWTVQDNIFDPSNWIFVE